MNGEIPLKDPQATPTYKTSKGVTLNVRPDGLILIADPSVSAVWSFANEEISRRVHQALDEWIRITDEGGDLGRS